MEPSQKSPHLKRDTYQATKEETKNVPVSQKESPKGRPKISWEAPEYVHTDKTTDWFWALGIVAVALVVITILLHNMLFALFLAVAAMTLGIYAAREPEIITFELNDRGVLTGPALHPYKSLDSFGIEHDEDVYKLLIKSKKNFMPYLVLPLTADLVPGVRSYLGARLEEKEHRESLAHKIFEFLGF